MFDAARLVFIDETSANTKMMRLHGRRVRGERLVDHVPQGHWKTITFVAALRRHGMRASQTIDGSMTGKKFLAYVERCLAPTLKRKDIVLVDNLPAHKAAGVREAIEARGAVLPIYDALYDFEGLRHVLVRQEAAAGHAAEGYARTSGKVGVCLVTSGPAATNLVTALQDALMDSIPIVAFTGQVPTHLIGNDAFQEADNVGITRSATKHNFLVKDGKDLAPIIKASGAKVG